MRGVLQNHVAAPAAGALLLAVLLSGCAAGGPPPYQARPSSDLTYGYTDLKIDASHYAVIYTDSDRDRAQNYLQLRAAQVAQAAGFAYFTFDTEGVAVQRKVETQFDQDMITNPQRSHIASYAIPLNAYMPQNNPTTQSLYYSAAGKISLLTPQQAQGNPKAVSAAQVLTRMGTSGQS